MYTAIVAPLVNVRPHPNADRLNLATVCSSQVILSKGIPENTLGIFFSDDGMLSQEMAHHNNLFSNPELNKDPDKKGFFSNPARVKAQNFRGEKSYGFWIELESVAWTGVDLSTLKKGLQFTELNGHEICRKYINPATLRAASRERKAQKLATRIRRKYSALKEHFDTKQLRKDVGLIAPGSILYLTSKCHGTSARTGNIYAEQVRIDPPILDYAQYKRLNTALSVLPQCIRRHSKLAAKRVLRWIELLLGFIVGLVNRILPVPSTYELISGTRRVVLDPNLKAEAGYYSGKTFRIDVHQKLKELGIPQGITIYLEIVGYDESGSPLMPGHSADKIEDKAIRKELKKLYGDIMEFSYGCDKNSISKKHRELIYRITKVSPDEHEVELSWPQVKAFCKLLGLETVPDLVGPIIYDGDKDKLVELCESFLDQPEGIDPRHIREGVCVRAEMPNGITTIQKIKSFWFLLLEGIAKSNPDTVDIEEAESVIPGGIDEV